MTQKYAANKNDFYNKLMLCFPIVLMPDNILFRSFINMFMKSIDSSVS